MWGFVIRRVRGEALVQLLDAEQPLAGKAVLREEGVLPPARIPALLPHVSRWLRSI